MTKHNNVTVIYSFHRNKRGEPVGCVLARPSSGPHKFSIGWSKANIKKGDKFSKATAIDVAFVRAEIGTNSCLPREMTPLVENMTERAKRYFKQ
jgi:hypothetical protein